jgi:hypothetical protein
LSVNLQRAKDTVPDRLAFCLDIDSTAWRAADRRTAGAAEFAVLKIVAPAAGDAEALPTVAAADESVDPLRADLRGSPMIIAPSWPW